jgi:hypothetical protein
VDGLLTRGRSQQLDDALSGAGRPAPPAVSREVAVATRLRQAGAETAPAPSAEFRSALRTRLMAVAAVQGVGATATSASPSAAPGRTWAQRATVVGAGALATVVAASGVAVAGSRSLPGDPFYGVKRTAEAVQLRVADGGREEGIRHLQFASTRMREVRALLLGRDAPRGAAPLTGLGDDDLEAVRAAMADMDDDTREGLRLLTGAYEQTRADSTLEELRRFAARQRAGLAEVMPALGGTALAQAQGSLALVDGVRAQADQLLVRVDCTAACDPARTAPGGGGGATAPCDCGGTQPTPSQAAVPPPAATPPGQQPPQQGSTTPGPQPSEGSSPPPPPAPAPGPSEQPPPQPRPSLPLPLPLPNPGATAPGQPLPSLDVPRLDDGVLPDLNLG